MRDGTREDAQGNPVLRAGIGDGEHHAIRLHNVFLRALPTTQECASVRLLDGRSLVPFKITKSANLAYNPKLSNPSCHSLTVKVTDHQQHHIVCVFSAGLRDSGWSRLLTSVFLVKKGRRFGE